MNKYKFLSFKLANRILPLFITSVFIQSLPPVLAGVEQAKISFNNEVIPVAAAEDLHLEIDNGKFTAIGKFVDVEFSNNNRTASITNIFVPGGQNLTLNITWENYPGKKLTGYWTKGKGIDIGKFTFIDVTSNSSCNVNLGNCSNSIELANSNPGEIITVNGLGVAFVAANYDLFTDPLPALVPLSPLNLAFGQNQVFDLDSILGLSTSNQRILVAANVASDLAGVSGNSFTYAYPVPTPLPVAGAAAFISFSRKLRIRLKSAQNNH
jgi:hypothetical protein